MYDKAAVFGNPDLAFFNFGVVKFLDPSTLQTNQMVVMGGAGKFENRFSTFKMVALQ